MIKRISWFISGAVAGVAGAGYTKRKVKQTAAQMAPIHVAKKATAGVRQRGTKIGDALREGRQAMQTKEAELRARRDGRVSSLADSVGPNDEVLVDGRPVSPGQVIVLHDYRSADDQAPKKTSRRKRA